MQAVILAGGFGTRLSHVVKDVPKPMAPIAGVPFLEYLYRELTGQGFDDFVFLTGHMADVIENHFREYGNVRFVHEDHPLGTGGALLNAWDLLESEFLLLNGDTFFDADFSLLYKYKAQHIKEPSILMALRFSEDVGRYGFVEFDENYSVESFIEKGALPTTQADGFINAGAYLIDKEILNTLHEAFHGEMLSLETDLFPLFIRNKSFRCLPLGGAFIDIGIPDDYKRAQKLIPETLKRERKPALFIDKDGTLIEDSGYVHGKEIVPVMSTLDLVREYRDKGFRLVIITNQAGVAKGKFTEQDFIDNINSVLSFYEENGIRFDGYEYCLYHENAVIVKYRKKSYARKPWPGMILKAAERLSIDLENSVMVGDNKEVDTIRLPYLRSVILDK